MFYVFIIGALLDLLTNLLPLSIMQVYSQQSLIFFFGGEVFLGGILFCFLFGCLGFFVCLNVFCGLLFWVLFCFFGWLIKEFWHQCWCWLVRLVISLNVA